LVFRAFLDHHVVFVVFDDGDEPSAYRRGFNI